MKIKKDFKELYNELQENSSEIKQIYEKAKEEKKFLNKIQLISCLIIDFLIIFLFLNNFSFNKYGFICLTILVPIIIIDTFVCLILYAVLGKEQRAYKQKFKEIVINNLINNFYDNVEYFPKKEMPERIYDEVEYNEYYNKYYSDDYLEAKINNKYDIGMAEVCTEHEETHKDSDGDTHTTTTTIFHGIFSKIVIDKSIESKLSIQKNGEHAFNKQKLEMDSRRI